MFTILIIAQNDVALVARFDKIWIREDDIEGFYLMADDLPIGFFKQTFSEVKVYVDEIAQSILSNQSFYKVPAYWEDEK